MGDFLNGAVIADMHVQPVSTLAYERRGEGSYEPILHEIRSAHIALLDNSMLLGEILLREALLAVSACVLEIPNRWEKAKNGASDDE